MTAITIEHGTTPDAAKVPEVLRGGIALSATLHVSLALLIVLGLPSLFRKPPPQQSAIAVQLVTLAPETRATQPNPFRPRPDAKPEPPPVAAPAPKPEPKPEPPLPSPEPPPSAAASPVAAPPPPKPEVKAPPAPPPPLPPPPKPIEAQAPPSPPPPVAEPKPKPKPEPKPVQQAAPPDPKRADPDAFKKLLANLEEKKPERSDFDALLKNLSPQKTAPTEEAPPTPRRTAATAPPSAQPKAPLGSQLTASEIDLVREQLRPCFNPPFGAKESPDLVADISVAMNPDGTVRQARVVDMSRYASDPVYSALADSGVRALRNPQCSPLRLSRDRYEIWKTFTFGVSTKDMQ